MRHAVPSALVALAVVACASSARADGLDVGARVGIGLPLGNATAAPRDSLSATVTNQIPIWLDAGYRAPRLYVGGFAAYGFGAAASELTTACGVCSVTDLRFGIAVHFHWSPGSVWDPWVGAGAGWESLGVSRSATAPGGSVSGGLTGFDFLRLEAGSDLAVASPLRMGPFAALELGTFTAGDASIRPPTVHGWFFIGIRGVLGFGAHDEH